MITGYGNSSQPFHGSRLTRDFENSCATPTALPSPDHQAPGPATAAQLASQRYMADSNRIANRHAAAASYLQDPLRPARQTASKVDVVNHAIRVRARPYPAHAPVVRTAASDVPVPTRALRLLLKNRPAAYPTPILGQLDAAAATIVQNPPPCAGVAEMTLTNRCGPGLARAFANWLVHDTVRITPHIAQAGANTLSTLDNEDSAAGLAIDALLGAPGQPAISYNLDAPAFVVYVISLASDLGPDGRIKRASMIREIAEDCPGSDAEVLFAFVATFQLEHNGGSAAQLVADGHNRRCHRLNEIPTLTAQTAAAIELYVAARQPVRCPTNPGVAAEVNAAYARLWRGPSAVTARRPADLPLGGTERRPNGQACREHTYHDALVSHRELIRQIAPGYIEAEGEIERHRRRQREDDIAARSLCVVPYGVSTRDASARVEAWAKDRYALTVETKIGVVGTSDMFTVWAAAESPIPNELYNYPYATVEGEHYVPGPEARAERFTMGAQAYTVVLRASPDAGYDAVLRDATSHRFDRILNALAPYLAALYLEELRRDTPAEVGPDEMDHLRRVAADYRGKMDAICAQAVAVSQERAAAQETAKAPATKGDYNNAIRKVNDLDAKGKALSDRAMELAGQIATTEDRIRIEDDPGTRRLREAVRIGKYLVDIGGPPPPEVEAAKCLIPPNLGPDAYNLATLRANPAFCASILDPTVTDYLVRLKGSISHIGIPSVCDLFSPKPGSGNLHSAGKLVEIYPNFRAPGHYHHELKSEYRALLLHDIGQRPPTSNVSVVLEAGATEASASVLEGAVRAVSNLGQTPDARSAESIQSITRSIAGLDTDQFGSKAASIGIMVQQLRNCLGDIRSAAVEHGRARSSAAPKLLAAYGQAIKAAKEAAAPLLSALRTAMNSGALRIRQVPATTVSPRVIAPTVTPPPDADKLELIIKQIEDSGLVREKRDSNAYSAVVGAMRKQLSEINHARTQNHIDVPAPVDVEGLCRSAASIGVNLTKVYAVFYWLSAALEENRELRMEIASHIKLFETLAEEIADCIHEPDCPRDDSCDCVAPERLPPGVDLYDLQTITGQIGVVSGMDLTETEPILKILRSQIDQELVPYSSENVWRILEQAGWGLECARDIEYYLTEPLYIHARELLSRSMATDPDGPDLTPDRTPNPEIPTPDLAPPDRTSNPEISTPDPAAPDRTSNPEIHTSDLAAPDMAVPPRALSLTPLGLATASVAGKPKAPVRAPAPRGTVPVIDLDAKPKTPVRTPVPQDWICDHCHSRTPPRGTEGPQLRPAVLRIRLPCTHTIHSSCMAGELTCPVCKVSAAPSKPTPKKSGKKGVPLADFVQFVVLSTSNVEREVFSYPDDISRALYCLIKCPDIIGGILTASVVTAFGAQGVAERVLAAFFNQRGYYTYPDPIPADADAFWFKNAWL
jgi:hypothetical protein